MIGQHKRLCRLYLKKYADLDRFFLTEGNATIKQVLKKNEYQESILSKIFKKTAKSHSLFQSQQQTQAIDIEEEDFRMSVNLLCVKGTSEKLRCIL